MKKTLSERLNDKPFKGPGRLIFWVLVDLAFLAFTVQQNVQYADRNNLLGTAVFFVLGLLWAFNLWCDLDRWYVPKAFPQEVPAQRSNTLADEE